MMKKFLYKIFLYGLFSFIILNLIAFLSLYFIGKSNLYKPEFIQNGVEEFHFDYVILGSSTGLTTLDTKLIDSVTGKKGLNISIDDTSMSTHFLMLEHFYAMHKKTDCVVLTVTPWDASEEKPVLNNNDYRFLPYVHNDYVYEYYADMEKDQFKTLTLSRFFPILGVSYYNTELFYPSLLTVVQPGKRNRFDDKGNYSYPVLSEGPKETKMDSMALKFENPFFNRIAKFCHQHKIKLMVYQSPIYNTKVTIEKSKITFINHSDLIKDSKLFYDKIHVNENGRKICSKTLAHVLK